MEEKEKLMLEMYDDLYLWMVKWDNPMATAAVLMATALRIYKTTLPEEDFEQMMDYVSDSRDHIQKFDVDLIDRKLN